MRTLRAHWSVGLSWNFLASMIACAAVVRVSADVHGVKHAASQWSVEVAHVSVCAWRCGTPARMCCACVENTCAQSHVLARRDARGCSQCRAHLRQTHKRTVVICKCVCGIRPRGRRLDGEQDSHSDCAVSLGCQRRQQRRELALRADGL